MNNADGKIINQRYCVRENYENMYSVFSELRKLGVFPKAITIDGNTSTIQR